MSGRAHAELQERQEALASRQHFGVAVFAEELDRLRERAGSVVVERSRDHALSFRCESDPVVFLPPMAVRRSDVQAAESRGTSFSSDSRLWAGANTSTYGSAAAMPRAVGS